MREITTPNWLGLLVILVMSTVGCASKIQLDPELGQASHGNTALKLHGRLLFSGGRDFLPSGLKPLPTAGTAEPVFAYEYFDRYRESTVPEIIALYNPFSLVGFPTGEDTIRIAAHLEIRVAGKTERTYVATGVIANTRNVFTGSPLAELRRRVLIAVADNIDRQMMNDAEAIKAILNGYSRSKKGH